MRNTFCLAITAMIVVFASCKKDNPEKVKQSKDLMAYSIGTYEPYTVTLRDIGNAYNSIIIKQPVNACISKLNTENDSTTYTYKSRTDYEGVDEVELQSTEKIAGGKRSPLSNLTWVEIRPLLIQQIYLNNKADSL